MNILLKIMHGKTPLAHVVTPSVPRQGEYLLYQGKTYEVLQIVWNVSLMQEVSIVVKEI